MNLVFSSHAIKRMFQRGISALAVHGVLDNPQLVAAYEDDKPYPSQLLFAVVDQQALHVLVATTDTVSESSSPSTGQIPFCGRLIF